MTVSIAYLNGRFVAGADAALPITDRGLVWGATAVDRCRTYRGKLFRWVEHLARFRRSCELCRIPQPVPDRELTHIAEQLVQRIGDTANANDEFVVVLFATPGSDRPTLGMTIEIFDGMPYRPLLSRGARLITPARRHVPDLSIPRQAKMRSRMHWWLAEQEAHDVDPESSALLLDGDGQVTETASANIVVVRDGAVWTPVRSAVLHGISLQVVEELCCAAGIPFHETTIRLEDCYSVSEMMSTSTPYGIGGVSSLNGRSIPWPGPVLARLRDAWTQLVGKDIWQQILPAG